MCCCESGPKKQQTRCLRMDRRDREKDPRGSWGADTADGLRWGWEERGEAFLPLLLLLLLPLDGGGWEIAAGGKKMQPRWNKRKNSDPTIAKMLFLRPPMLMGFH